MFIGINFKKIFISGKNINAIAVRKLTEHTHNLRGLPFKKRQHFSWKPFSIIRLKYRSLGDRKLEELTRNISVHAFKIMNSPNKMCAHIYTPKRDGSKRMASAIANEIKNRTNKKTASAHTAHCPVMKSHAQNILKVTIFRYVVALLCRSLLSSFILLKSKNDRPFVADASTPKAMYTSLSCSVFTAVSHNKHTRKDTHAHIYDKHEKRTKLF